MTDKICRIKEIIKKQRPLIHCITNPISVNGCANVILSVGAKPVMAEHPKEVSEITSTADALMLNTGNITDARMESAFLSMETAKEINIPVLLDVVGIACSKFRREYSEGFLKKFTPSVIKGNYSEIKALYDERYCSLGVDAEETITTEYIISIATKLAKKHNTVILATGKVDIITDGRRIVCVKNGTPALAYVTGTGCMLGALCTAFMTAENPLDATISACCYFGICGELSETENGTGSFFVNLLDRISTLDKEKIEKYHNVEEKQ